VKRSKSLLDAQVGEFTTFMAKVFEHQPRQLNRQTSSDANEIPSMASGKSHPLRI
jgi:hypothetical protein